MTEPYKVSNSKMKIWLRCRRAYHHKYVEKIRKKRKSRSLHVGSVVHNMIEAQANGQKPFKVLDEYMDKHGKFFKEEIEKFGDVRTDVGNMMEAYFEYWDQDVIDYLEIDGKKAEHEFEIEVDPGIILNGFIDGVGTTPNELTWLVEHKTFKKKPSDDHRWRNLQGVLYIRVIQMLGWVEDLDGVLWNYMKNTPATVPQKLKKGGMSVKKINSLPSVVAQSISDYDLDPADYKQFIEDVNFKQKDWFQRIYVPINESVVTHVYDGFLDTARLMSETHGQRSEMTIEQHCDWCDFEPLCRAQLTGGDIDYLKENKYEPNKRDEEERSLPEIKGKKARKEKVSKKIAGKKAHKKVIRKKKKLPTV